MAIFTKKLRILNSAGIQQDCNIYSTTSEAGSNYMYATVDGTQGYISLCSTSASYASSGRVLKSGTTYAVGKSYPVAYNYTTMTSGSGTFTVPNGVYRLRVTCVGGGAGGCDYCGGVSGNGGYTANSGNVGTQYTVSTNTAGGRTTFGSVSANGATSCVITLTSTKGKSCSGSGENCQSCSTVYVFTYTTSTGTSYGYNNGTFYYTRGLRAGAAATPLVNINGTTIISAGAGGGVDNVSDNSSYPQSCGGSGYRTVTTISVTPGQQISWSVGGGGMCWIFGRNYTSTTGNSGSPSGTAQVGAAGAILVEYGLGIE